MRTLNMNFYVPFVHYAPGILYHSADYDKVLPNYYK